MNRKLHRRILAIGSTRQRRAAQLTPVAGPRLPGTSASPASADASASVTGGEASPGGVPMTLPTSAVLVYPSPADNQYVTVGVVELEPMFTADGAPIMATSPGHWDQLYAAGNPRDGAQRRRSTTSRRS
jgi:hypothetical protein